MALRIQGGEFRSRLLASPDGRETRPTRALVRQAAFNMLQGVCPGSRVLDLFAGSGAMGLEELSRGADYAVLCDFGRDAVEAISANIKALKVESRCAILQMGWQAALKRLSGEDERFDVIILDPPYQLEVEEVLREILQKGMLLPEGWILYEHASGKQPETPPGLALSRRRSYGESALSLFQMGMEE
jgi:16S rRNA (guanine966-N2)-methyltransferase